MSWLSVFANNNRNPIGNALKNIAPLAGFIPGVGPYAAMGLGALGGAVGQGIRKGSNIGDIVGQGIQSGGQAGAVQGIKAGIGKLMAPKLALQTAKTAAAPVTQGAGYADPVTGQILGDVGDLGVELNKGASTGTTFSGPPRAFVPRGAGVAEAAPGANLLRGPNPFAAPFVPPPINGASAFGQTPGVASLQNLAGRGAPIIPTPPASFLSRLGASIEKSPTGYGMGVQGLGKLATAPAESRRADAEIRALDAQTAANEYKTEQERRRDIALQSLRQQLSDSSPFTQKPRDWFKS